MKLLFLVVQVCFSYFFLLPSQHTPTSTKPTSTGSSTTRWLIFRLVWDRRALWRHFSNSYSKAQRHFSVHGHLTPSYQTMRDNSQASALKTLPHSGTSLMLPLGLSLTIIFLSMNLLIIFSINLLIYLLFFWLIY